MAATSGNPIPAGSASGSPPRRRRKTWLLVGCLAGTGALIVIVLVACVAAFLWLGSSDLKPTLEEFLNTVEARRYDRAFSSCSSQMRNSMRREDFQQVFETINDAAGQHQSLSMKSINYRATPQGQFAQGGFVVYYKRGTATINASFHRENGRWRVLGINYESDLLKEPLTCTKCKTVNTLGAKFCKQCGTPVVGQSEIR